MHIVILPGLDGTGLMLEEFIKMLKQEFSVQLISYPSDIILSYVELTKLVSRQLPKDRPYVILAESFSGPIAAKIGSQKLKHTKGIIFAASFVKNPTYFHQSISFLMAHLPIKSRFLLNLARPFTFGKWSSEHLNRKLEEAVFSVERNVLAHRIQEVLRVNEADSLQSIDIPMLYIQAPSDRIVSKSVATKLSSANHRLSVQKIDGPHFILQTNPKKCLEKISNFIENEL